MNTFLKDKKKLETFGQRVKYIRRTLINQSRSSLANKYGIVLRTLTGWESDRSAKLSDFFVEKLLTAFLAEGIICSKEWLLSGRGEKPKRQMCTYQKDIGGSLLNKIEAKNKQSLLKETLEKQELNYLNEKLLEACKKNKNADIARLISKGADPYSLIEDTFHKGPNFSPLSIIIKKENDQAIDIFLEKELCTPLSSQENKRKETLLHWAAYYGNKRLVDKLLGRGVDIDRTDKEGATPFVWAVYMGQKTIATYLFEQGADIKLADRENSSPLYWACYRGHKNLVKFLLSKEANVFQKNDRGYTALDISIENGHASVVRLLLDYHDSLLEASPCPL